MKNRIIKIAVSFFVILSMLFYPSCRYLPTFSFESSDFDENSLVAHFIDVGQGDSTLIICAGEAMLVDGGPGSAGSTVPDYLKKFDIKTLKYVVATHPHEDHIGGLSNVFKDFEVENILMPDATANTAVFEKLLDAIENEGIGITVPQVGDKFKLGTAEITILSPSEEYSDLNDSSIVFMISFDGRNLLFTGDVGAQPANKLLEQKVDISADIYKVAHHGSAKNNSEKFIKAVNPAYSVISCAAGNSYGHPHKEVLERLTAVNSNIYRTDKNGTVVIYVSREKTDVKTEK